MQGPGITLQHAADSDATISIRCCSCERLTVRAGPLLILQLGKPDMPLRVLQERLVCSSCGSRAEVLISLPSEAVEQAKGRARPIGKACS